MAHAASGGSLSDHDKVFLQLMMREGCVTATEAEQLLRQAAESTDQEEGEHLERIVARINDRLRPLSLEIRSGGSDEGVLYYAFVSMRADEYSKLGTSLDKMELLAARAIILRVHSSWALVPRKYVDRMTLQEVGSRACVGSRESTKSREASALALRHLVAHKFLEEKGETQRYTLGMRAQLELRDWFVSVPAGDGTVEEAATGEEEGTQ